MDTITLIGLLAAVCTTISFLPQTIKTIKTQNTRDLSLTMYLVFTIGLAMWMVYGILLVNWPIIIANGVTMIFTAIILYLILRNKVLDKKQLPLVEKKY